MNNIDHRFMKYRRMRRCRRVFFFMLGFGLVMGFTMFYFYEWNRMPDVIYVEKGTVQVIDLDVPVKGELYKESVEAGMYMEPAVESISQSDGRIQNIEIDFSKEIVLEGIEDDVYCADLKLFGFLPYKTVKIESREFDKVIPSGQTIGIYVKMEGIYVIDVGEFKAPDGSMVEPCKDLLKSDGELRRLHKNHFRRHASGSR